MKPDLLFDSSLNQGSQSVISESHEMQGSGRPVTQSYYVIILADAELTSRCVSRPFVVVEIPLPFVSSPTIVHSPS